MSGLSLRYQPAPASIRSLAVGFLERRDVGRDETALELPLHHALAQFMLDADYVVRDPAAPETSEIAPRAGLWGPASRTRLGRSQGRLHVFVAILTARGARAVAGAPLSELVDRRLDLEAVASEASRSWIARLRDAATFEARTALACRWLADVSIGTAAEETCRLVDGIAEHRLRGPVTALSRLVGVGPRALHGRFTRQAGWPPKTWLRVSRLQRVLRTVHPAPWGPAADGDVRLEFTDDAHLARDFHDLTGLTLAAYRRMKRSSGDPLLHTVLAPSFPLPRFHWTPFVDGSTLAMQESMRGIAP
ncbi:AraC family transcriptional regulator [Caulobacter mirabilis]|uniref:HTH araC/xylS-type domain-containing protein n=1 Tax=Caulobacter mirabilis TaxID=69666 RepID=A0A2D2AZV2_9CAUL|nr:helix-turn-helix domain-containing protein [Caulobacter mirabilis]ATQ43457.1 hypothetical protein CSW64_14080 [Caulobacter mirabilis]